MLPDFDELNQYFLVLSSPMSQPDGHSANGNGLAPVGAASRSSLPLDWENLARATAHPLRVSILEILSMDGGRTLSPSDLGRELQIPLSNTNYHVTELAKAELIVLARERQVRGATEHFYRIHTSTHAKKPEPEKRTTGLEPATFPL
jgi:DNA-binding transcriptional ArsR family regulator